MLSNEDQEAIFRFVFSNEAHVELALGVISSRKSICERIIKDFLMRLDEDLTLKAKQLGDTWKVENELIKNPLDRWKGVYLTKDNWRGLYRISLSPERWDAKEFILGVWNDWDQLRQRLDDGRIREGLQGHVQSGKVSDWWPYYRLADPYKDWDEKTLASFLGEKNVKAISYLTSEMFNIAKNTEALIDKLVHDWWEKNQEIAKDG